MRVLMVVACVDVYEIWHGVNSSSAIKLGQIHSNSVHIECRKLSLATTKKKKKTNETT